MSTNLITSQTETPAKKAWTSKGKTYQQLTQLLDGAAATHVPVYLESDPGMAKTAMIHQYGAERGLYVYVMLGATMTPEDINGLPANRAATTITGERALDADGLPYNVTDYALNHWADMFFQLGKGVWFVDELPSSTPAVQAAMLTAVQTRIVGGRKLPDDVLIVAAGNPVASAADGWGMAPPLANRFVHISHNLEFEEWADGMKVGFGKDLGEAETEARRLFVAFLTTYKDQWNAIPKDKQGNVDTVAAGGAWPSPRSWDNAASFWGAITEPSMRLRLLRGAVGEVVGDNFKSWLDALNIPSYEEIMAHPERLNWKKFKADEIYTILDMVADNVKVENYERTIEVFKFAADAGRNDVATSIFYRFCQHISVMAQEIPNKKDRETFAFKALPVVSRFGVDYQKAGLGQHGI